MFRWFADWWNKAHALPALQQAAPPAVVAPVAAQRIAIVYVHGMGDQWRLEDASSLVTSMCEYGRLTPNTRTGKPSPDVLLTKPESIRTANQEWNYLSTTLPEGTILHVHDAYWAPLTGAGVTATEVLGWLRRQLIVPFLRLHSPWRRLPQLRRGILRQVVATERLRRTHPRIKMTPVQWNADAQWLLNQYNAFQQPGQAATSKGTFHDFRLWLNNARATREQFMAAQTWFKQAVANDQVAIAAVLSLVLMTFVFALLATEAITSLFGFMTGAPSATWLARYRLEPTLAGDAYVVPPLVLLTILTTLGWTFGVRPFFEKYLGDAVQWATYHETSKNFAVREAILTRTSAIIRHVLETKPAYERVVVVAHSLGSVIAHDTLLRLARDGCPGLDRISHVLTFGSPIDKFTYFFDAQRGQTKDYEYVVDKLRGCVFGQPFHKKLRWENFYEEGDPISGTIHTAQSDTALKQVYNTYTPNAMVATVAANHTGYTRNRMLLSQLWNAVIPGFYSPEKSTVDAIAHARWMRLRYAFVLAIPWTLLLSYVLHGAFLLATDQLISRQLAIPYVYALAALTVTCAVVGWGGGPKRVRPVALGLAALGVVAALGVWGPPQETAGPWVEIITPWSAGIGTVFPIILALIFMAVATLRWNRSSSQGFEQRQLYVRPNPFLAPLLVSLLGAFVMLSVYSWPGEPVLLPLWWWRNMCVYATLSLMVLGAAQLVFSSLGASRPRHML